MENTKLFKDSISENLYKDVLEYFKKLHNEKQAVENIQNKIKNRSKLYNGIVVVSGSIGLVTIGMAISNSYEVYKVAKESLQVAGFACLAMATISTNMQKGINALRREHMDMINTGPLQDMNRYVQFENRFVQDLNAAGIKAEYRHVSDYTEFATMRDLWKESNNVEADLKEKTAAYVKNLVEEYTDPANVNKPRNKIRPY